MKHDSRWIYRRSFQFGVGVSFLALTFAIVASVAWVDTVAVHQWTIQSLYSGHCASIDQRIAAASVFVREFPLWIFIALSGLSSSVLYFSRSLSKRAHLRFVDATMRGKFGPRWFNRGIVSIFLIVLLSLLTGVFDVPLLLVIAILQLLGHVFLYEMERSNRIYVSPDWSPTLIGGLIFSLQVAILIFAGFSIHELSILPSVLRFFIAGFFIFKSGLLLNNIFQHAAVSVWCLPNNGDISYMVQDYSVFVFASLMFYELTSSILSS